MSRDVGAKNSVTIAEKEAAERKTEQGKLIFTRYRGHDCALLLQNDRLKAASFLQTAPSGGNGGRAPAAIGAVYIGKIKNMAKNIEACFVEIANGEICFLSLKNASEPYLVNRVYDGRLFEGDELLVQVERAAQKTKQASVTAHLSLANDSFVILMGTRKVGYSANLDGEAKKRIQFLFTEGAIFDDGSLSQNVQNLLLDDSAYTHLTLPATGCIVRANAAKVQDSGELLNQFFTLAAQYADLLHTASHRSCFSCIKEAPSALENVLEQLAGADEYSEIVTDDSATYAQLRQITASFSKPKPLRLYQDSLLPLSKLYSVESRLDMALERRIWLKSGGYLIIEPTEALTVIDVNSGKYEAKKSADETYLKINMEAAEEIMLQLRLRNLSGIILVDFINMRAEEKRRVLLKRLRELAACDPSSRCNGVRTTIVDMTPLGLVEITRKKVNKPLAEQWADCLRRGN